MTRAGQEPWICGSCRSVNEVRSQRCYKCRTPRELAQADVSQLIVAGAGASDAAHAVGAAARAAVLGGYESSEARAGLAQCLLVAIGVLALLVNITGADLIGRLVGGDSATVRQDLDIFSLLALVLYVSAALTLVAWAAWLSRVVANIPKVGLGWPNVTPRAAFIENFLPGLNLFRVPAILRDVMSRLEPHGGRGNGLIVAAWLGLFGGLVLPYVGGWLLLLVPSRSARITAAVVVGQLALGLTLAGVLFLVLIIRRVEAGMRTAARSVESATPQASPASAG